MISVLRSIFERIEFPHAFAIGFPDGSWYRRGEEPRFTIQIKTERALRELLRNPSLGFGESYMAEEIELEGDLQEIMHLGFIVKDGFVKTSFLEKLKFTIGYFSRRNTREGSRKNIAAHYDLGNDFYSLWLDREAMQYTCAYFESERDSLEKAQLAKIDLVCRKLRLAPGETVVEAGCGWGGFALHAARKYGVKIRSYNISKEQIAYARERAQKFGVGPDRIEYVLDDYRNIGADGKVYDKFVSIGMLEHVGVENYGRLYDLIARVVRPNGLALVHSIGKSAPTPTDVWLEKYIFPGSYMPSLGEMVGPAEKQGRELHVVDVENLRYHYALTLDHWAARLEQHADSIRAQYGEAFYRMFRMYLHASAAGFRWGGIMLYQTLLVNGFDNQAPLTRKHFFGGAVAHTSNGAAAPARSVNGARRSARPAVRKTTRRS